MSKFGAKIYQNDSGGRQNIDDVKTSPFLVTVLNLQLYEIIVENNAKLN